MKIVIITGQTATGKTALAVNRAKSENGELINADATQVYKNLDILTGKDLEDIGNIPIHLMSFVDPKENFSSAQWSKLAEEKIKDILARNKLPIIVGGSYFYIQHLLYGIETGGTTPDWNLRRKMEKKSVVELQEQLKKLSPDLFNKLNESDRQNPRRLMRKIEIALNEKTPDEPRVGDFKSIELIGLRYTDKVRQLKTIRRRVEKRLTQGAIEEVKSLLNQGFEVTDPGLRANATFEIAQYLRGEISKEELVEKWVTLDFHYSKRQYTLMKKDPNIKWIEV